MAHEITPYVTAADVREVADQVAASYLFQDYQSRRAENTLRRQAADLRLFEQYLHGMGIAIETSMFDSPEAWRGIGWGLVAGFVQWMLRTGYSIGSINVRLSTIKMYAKLASQAGTLDKLAYLQIKDVGGYSYKEQRRVDEKREDAGMETRTGSKKAEAVLLSLEQARMLKNQPNTPQGRRDRLLMCLLLDHGLRCGEVALLEVEHIHLKRGELRFYRPKVSIEQTHRLSRDTRIAIRDWFGFGDAPAAGKLLRASRKDGSLGKAGMSERAITQRVCDLGMFAGIEGLSAHDCRHYWATNAARQGTDPFALQEAGGWRSLDMPRRYVEAARIANEGVKIE